MTDETLKAMAAELPALILERDRLVEEYLELQKRVAAHASMLWAYGWPIPETNPKIVIAPPSTETKR